MSKVIGIDVSKTSFDVAFLAENDSATVKKYQNHTDGFEAFHTALSGDEHVVMEATGAYHLALATYLHERGIKVSVINPLVIRRFSQMSLSRTKTDHKDAVLIARYGRLHAPQLWRPRKGLMEELRQCVTVMDSLVKQQTALTNQLQARQALPARFAPADHALQQALEAIELSIVNLEKDMLSLVEKECRQTYVALKSIPGVGPKTAMLLIAITDGFERFENVKQLVSYIGLSPRIFESGTSVKGKARIAKMGMGTIRKLLYMCAWSAKRCNAACRELYDRLKAKGKPEKVIKIAIAHKLLRIAFAIGRKQTTFEKNHHLKFAF